MRNLHSSVNPVSAFVSCPGSRDKIIYESRFNGRSLVVEPTGKLDIQADIESYAPFCDLNYMLSRLRVGDSSVLAQRQAMYGDFSGLPDNPIDAINLVRNAESRFAMLSAEEKLTYNNDYRVWLADLMSGSSVAPSVDRPSAELPVKEVDPVES